eukprot:Rhum_TRINITY_DN14705_c31_g1::Rhum_TRINITY_DN14705_c31_g1_i1::g.112368::m.112368
MGVGRDAGEQKYIPPNFDPRQLPKTKVKKGGIVQTTRIMMPMGVQCATCGEWIARDKKFLSVKEKAEGEFYLEEQIIRLKIRCPRCHGEIAIKTDPENHGYVVEYGAHRLYQHHVREAEREEEEREERERERGDAMAEHNQKVRETQREMSALEKLEEVHHAQSLRHGVDEEALIKATLEKHVADRRRREEEELEEDRREADRAFRRLERQQQAGKRPLAASSASCSPVPSAKRGRLGDGDGDDEGREASASASASPAPTREPAEAGAAGGAVAAQEAVPAVAVEEELLLVVKKKKKKKKSAAAAAAPTGLGGLAGYGDSD